MNKEEFISRLEKINLPKCEYIIMSGGSLLMHGLRKTTADLDLCVTKKLAKEIDLYNAPKDEKGFFVPFEDCQIFDDFDKFDFDVIDGYQCESLPNILEFKLKANRPKDQKDIEALKKVLGRE